MLKTQKMVQVLKKNLTLNAWKPYQSYFNGAGTVVIVSFNTLNNTTYQILPRPDVLEIKWVSAVFLSEQPSTNQELKS